MTGLQFLPVESGYFLLPKELVTRHLSEADLPALRLLLHLYACGFCTDTETALAVCGCSEQELERAVEFWLQRGVLILDPKGAATAAPPVPARAEKPRQQFRPEYRPQDIDAAARRDPSLKDLLSLAQTRLGRPLSRTDTEILFSFYDWLGLPPDVILLLLEDCAAQGKTNLRYIEKAAIDWESAGIKDAAAAEAHLAKQAARRSATGMVRRTFGIGERRLTPKEEGYITVWTEEWGFGEDLIGLAYERCADKTAKLSFAYINRILAAWHDKGIRTREEAEAEPAKGASGQKSGAAKPDKPVSFDIAEYEQWSYNQLIENGEEG